MGRRLMMGRSWGESPVRYVGDSSQRPPRSASGLTRHLAPASRRRLISAIRDSDTIGAGGRSALEKEFDRAIEDELEQVDTQGLFAGTVKGKKKRPRNTVSIHPHPSQME